MLEGIDHAVGAELALDGEAGAAHAGRIRVAALNHKAGNDAMEAQAVVKAVLHELDKGRHGVGRRFGIQLDLHHIAVFHLNGHNRIHVDFLHFTID